MDKEPLINENDGIYVWINKKAGSFYPQKERFYEDDKNKIRKGLWITQGEFNL